ncbi:MAG: tetratricopeptide repeat protein [Planctomycetota bacterium]
MNFLNNVILRLWYVWIVIITILSFSIFSAINLTKMKTNKIEECMNIYYEYEEIREKYGIDKSKEAEKEKALKEYLAKLEKSYNFYKDMEYSDYLLLRQAEVLEELKEKDKALEIYKKLDNSIYNCSAESKGCTIASLIASLILTRTSQNKEIWEKEILKNIYKKADPTLFIVTKDVTLKIKLKYYLFPDNSAFLINSVRNNKVKKVKVIAIEKDFIDLKIEGELPIPQNSYINFEKPPSEEFAGKKNFIMFKTSWDKNGKPQDIDYSILRICKKCELHDVEHYSLLGEVDIEVEELEKLKRDDESLSIFLEEAEVKVPMPNFLRRD